MPGTFFSPQLDRRTVLGLGLSTAAVAAGLTAGCAPGDGSEADGPVSPSERVPLPTHVVFETVPADLKGENGSSDAFLHYPANPPVTVDGVPGDGQPITALASYYLAAPPPMSENAAWQHLNQQLGSEFQFQPVPAADYSARFATTVAGNDLPTMMELAKVARLPELVRARFVDLTEHLSGDAVTRYPNLANLPPAAWQAGVFNNAIYGIPTDRGMWQTGLLFQRSDLIAAMGADAGQVTDFDDLFALCEQLTDSRNSVWALTNTPVAYVRQMLGVPNMWQLDGGNLTNAYEVPEQEEVLNACIRLWEAGVVHPDAFALSGAEAKQLFGSGRTLITYDSYPAWFQYHREQTVGETFDIDGMPLPGYDGGQGTLHLGRPAYSVGAISQGNEDRVETILDIWNYLAAPFGSAEHLSVIYGEEGVNYTLEGSDPVQTERGLREALSLVTLVCAPRVGYFPNDPGVTTKFFEHMKQLAPQGVDNPAIYRYSAAESQNGAELTARLDSEFNDIIQGRKKISDWADSVATWRSDGGDQIRAELEEALAAE
ncbi:extracellular solute-binding protein [Occultella aeris]|nr:extracellular solute-binding protein [Occultella aeris]